MFDVAVAGASGYAGGELLRLLLGHPEVRVGAVTAHSSAGDRLGRHHPQLLPLADRVLEPTAVETLAGHDVVVLALPHAAGGEISEALDADTVVIDVSADHRLTDADDWTAFYPGPHLGGWPYGMPELVHHDGSRQRERLSQARRVAVPGCYPTSVTLALAPGLAADVIDPGDVVVVAASGTSGAGRSTAARMSGAEVMGSMSPYGVGGTHRHTPEIEQNLSLAAGSDVCVSFTPTLAPMPRGILATCTARLAPHLDAADPATAAAVRDAWQKAYADEAFVHVLPEGQWPRTADTLGANTVLLQVALDPRSRRVVAVAAVDNLTKGTAGAAVQCMNLALDLPEVTGLTTVGVAP